MTISSIQSPHYQDSALYSRTQTRSSTESASRQNTADTVSFSSQARSMAYSEMPEKEMTSQEFKAENFKERDTPKKSEAVPTKVTLMSMMMDALLLAQLAENGDGIVAAPSDAQNTQEGASNTQGDTAQTARSQDPVKETAEAAKSKPSGMFGNSGKVSEIKQALYTVAASGGASISDVSKAMGSASTAPSMGSGGAGGAGKTSAKNDSESSKLLVV